MFQINRIRLRLPAVILNEVPALSLEGKDLLFL